MSEFDSVVNVVYEDLRRHAHHVMAGDAQRHTLTPTGLVHEAILRMIKQGSLRADSDRATVYRFAARVMLQVLCDHRRRKKCERFELTEESFALLRAEHVPEAVLSKLSPLKDKEFETREGFLVKLTNGTPAHSVRGTSTVTHTFARACLLALLWRVQRLSASVAMRRSRTLKRCESG